MKKNIDELDNIDMEEMIERVEYEARKIERKFLRLFTDIPVFDYELN